MHPVVTTESGERCETPASPHHDTGRKAVLARLERIAFRHGVDSGVFYPEECREVLDMIRPSVLTGR